MSVKSGGEARVKELTREIYVGLLIQEIIDEAVSIDGDVDAVDTSGKTRKVTRLSGCEGYRRKGFLFYKGVLWFHWRDGSDGEFNDRESIGAG